MHIRAVAFDLWETLITDTAELSRRQERLRLERMEQVLTARGFGETAARLELAYRALWHRCQELYWSDDRDVPCRRQIEHLLEALDLDPATFDAQAFAELEHAYAHAALEILPAPVQGAAAVLRELRGRDLRLGMISNTGRTPGYVLREILERLGMAESLQAMVFSNEHGECKPRASIFTSLREALGVPPEEIVFVGDNLYSDVHGAKSSGMRAVHFAPASRGTAVAPHFEHGLTIVPDATIRTLGELPGVIDELARR